jgi:type IV pilus assembly protein PilO
MKLTSIQKILAAVVLIAVISVAVILLVIVPKFGELSALDADIQAANDQVAQTQTLLAQLQQAKANAAITQAGLLQLANQFPENPELPSLIIELQDVSNSAGTRFNSVSPQEPIVPPGQAFTELPISIQLRGQWSDILDYMRRVNRMTRAIRITDVALAPSETSTSPTDTTEPPLTADLQIRAYVMPANAAAPASPAGAPKKP